MAITVINVANSVETQVRYLASKWVDAKETPRIFDRDSRRANTEIRDVSILDARAIRDTFSLNESGFSLFEHETKVTDFQDLRQIEEIYYPEVIQFVKDRTEASEVFTTQHLVRTEDTSDFNKAYARFIHCDYSIDTTIEFSHARLRAEGKDPADYRGAEFAWYNTWQPFDHVVFNNPLAVIDSSTVADSDIIEYIYGGYGKESKSSMPVFNPRHQLYFFSHMTPSEIMLIKQLDTRNVAAKMTPHTSFEDPSSDVNAPPRRSIEVRVMSVFRQSA